MAALEVGCSISKFGMQAQFGMPCHLNLAGVFAGLLHPCAAKAICLHSG